MGKEGVKRKRGEIWERGEEKERKGEKGMEGDDDDKRKCHIVPTSNTAGCSMTARDMRSKAAAKSRE